MSNNNDNIQGNEENQTNQQLQRDPEDNNALIISPRGSPRRSREGTPDGSHTDGQAQFENVEAMVEALQKLITAQVNKVVQALVSKLPAGPPTPTPNNNTLVNPRSGLVNSGSGGTPSESQEGEPGNLVNSDLQNLVLTLQKQLKEQSDRIEQILGVSPVIKEVDMDKYSQQPWKPNVAPLPIPKKFKMLDIPKYDGTIDPRDQVTAFTTGILSLKHTRELQRRKKNGRYFKIKQGDSKLHREFVDRFQRERMTLPRVPDNWAAIAFTGNLNEKSSEATRRLKESLREFPATTWNDVYNRYNTKLRIEEDTVPRFQKEENVSSRCAETEKRSGKNRYEPYMGPAGKDSRSKQDNQRYDHRSRNRESGSSSRFRNDRNHYESRDDDKNLKARFGGYNFNVSTSELVVVLRSMGDKEPPKPPSPKRTVNVISGGEDINGISYTAANKISKVTITQKKRVWNILEEDNITFNDADVDGILTPHNNALVISLIVYDANVKRVLIDSGSSVNIILLRVLRKMKAEDKVIPKAHTLFGFDNSSVVTKGEVTLTTFTEGVDKDTKF
ncbi:uncharacterized protein [Nicotiana sylvestris]|uniref:uncharacterized protein n=1 Tax=Nicotiana sylvestris TaxID=4096 RepID=UPI00388CB938